jgi:hypothetical protein
MAPQFDEVEATDILMAAQQKQWAPIQFQGNCMTEPVIVTTGLS